MTQERILIVDDDALILDSISELLRLEGYQVDAAGTPEQALKLMEGTPYNLLLTDVNMPNVNGFELLKLVRRKFPSTVVVLITVYGSIENAVESIKLGAVHYVTKPIIDDEIKLIIARSLQQQKLVTENRSLREQLDIRYSFDNIIGQDYKMRKLFDLVKAISDTDTTILVTGESGTGKTLLARAVHHNSSRRNGPFVEVNCGALPDTLLESELFGHMRGAFTGAFADKPGKFQAADGGTIFLDEISTASPALQIKLLRVMQDSTFEQVGGTKSQQVDVRFILATNKNLEEEVKTGAFREDLYYRVHVMPLHLPSLRERVGDIEILANHFLRVYASRMGKDISGFSEAAKTALQTYHWPGNVRELENSLERAVILAGGSQLELTDLSSQIQGGGEGDEGRPGEILPLKKALEEPEKRIIKHTLETCNWNRQSAAALLKINRTTLYMKMKKYE
ncbi:MAG TPA: sigma-54 dependent transcriptional regulator, partial [Planctomycetota bacterium]|nr:sigma-54 dependent transcriptional regulator [Planctomycetota bacterium]